MNKRRILIAAVVLVLAVPTLPYLMLLATGGIFDCQREAVVSKRSPDESYAVRIYTVDCGATTSVSTHVEIDFLGSKSDDADVVVFRAEGNRTVTVDWEGATTLVIGNSDPPIPGDDILWRVVTWQPIEIRFEGF